MKSWKCRRSSSLRGLDECLPSSCSSLSKPPSPQAAVGFSRALLSSPKLAGLGGAGRPAPTCRLRPSVTGTLGLAASANRVRSSAEHSLPHSRGMKWPPSTNTQGALNLEARRSANLGVAMRSCRPCRNHTGNPPDLIALTSASVTACVHTACVCPFCPASGCGPLRLASSQYSANSTSRTHTPSSGTSALSVRLEKWKRRSLRARSSSVLAASARTPYLKPRQERGMISVPPPVTDTHARERTRLGAAAASLVAIMPPMLKPTMWQGSFQPRWSMTSKASCAMAVVVYSVLSAGQLDLPMPMLSSSSSSSVPAPPFLCSALSCPIMVYHAFEGAANPMMSTTLCVLLEDEACSSSFPDPGNLCTS
mmetsp:Transcript_30747/g.78572  ORF Transcript_30747/g.78572 Transcript_30747/m.78572 type:complete len:366 (+) Transcript_30747:300-1397(+)